MKAVRSTTTCRRVRHAKTPDNIKTVSNVRLVHQTTHRHVIYARTISPYRTVITVRMDKADTRTTGRRISDRGIAVVHPVIPRVKETSGTLTETIEYYLTIITVTKKVFFVFYALLRDV